MPILNPEHLLEQADRLTAPPPAGPPRQVDLRRAISAAYYAVFHFVLIAGADEFVGRINRRTQRYALVYRSADHRSFLDLCKEALKPTPVPKYLRYLPGNGLGRNIQAFASAAKELQEKRHLADYDPSYRVKTSDAAKAIGTARSAIASFQRANGARRKAFLTLLLFSPR